MKKKNPLYLTYLCTLFAALTFSGCGKSLTEQIHGTWLSHVKDSSLTGTMTTEFADTGLFKMKINDRVFREGKFKVDEADSTISFFYSADSDWGTPKNFSLSDDGNTFKLENSSFTRVED